MNYIKKDTGKVISLWSPVHGKGCVSSNTALISAFFSLVSEKEKVLVLSNDTLCNVQCFLCEGPIKDGLSPIYTLASTGNLSSKDNFSVFTKSLRSNYELIGNSSKEEFVLDNLADEIDIILEKAKEIYDYIFIDVLSGVRNETSQKILGISDFLIFNLPQDYNILNQFAARNERFYLSLFEDKKTLVNISNYMDYRHFPKRKIEKILKQKVSVISNDEYLHQALTNQEVIDFLKNEIKFSKKEDRETILELNSIYEIITSSLGGGSNK